MADGDSRRKAGGGVCGRQVSIVHARPAGSSKMGTSPDAACWASWCAGRAHPTGGIDDRATSDGEQAEDTPLADHEPEAELTAEGIQDLDLPDANADDIRAGGCSPAGAFHVDMAGRHHRKAMSMTH